MSQIENQIQAADLRVEVKDLDDFCTVDVHCLDEDGKELSRVMFYVDPPNGDHNINVYRFAALLENAAQGLYDWARKQEMKR